MRASIKKFRYLLALGALALSVPVLSYAVSPIQLGGSIWPLTFISQNPINGTDEFNQMLILMNQQAASWPPQLQGNGFGTATTANPLVQVTFLDMFVSTSLGPNLPNGGILVASSGTRKIFPAGGFTVYASGLPTANTGLSIIVRCFPSTNIIASMPANLFVSGIPIGPFYSASGAFASATGPQLGSALTAGCLAGDSVVVSASTEAGITGTTDLFWNFPYTVQ